MRAVLILSGGLDSTTLLYRLRANGFTVQCLSFLYGQRHAKELECAKRICTDLGVEHRVVDLSAIQPLLAGSALSDSSVEVPEGHYAEESMKATVVPNRNMIMLSIAMAWAVSSKAEYVAYAAHGGDHAIYPDCRPAFVNVMAIAGTLCDWHPVSLVVPYLHNSKADIVKDGLELGVPYQHTWTCYKGQEYPCGVCGSCTERLEAFAANGVPDPLQQDADCERPSLQS